MDLYAAIADERRRAADLVEGLSEDQLATPSLCDAWTVRDVSAHLLMPLVTPMPKFGFAMLRNRMNFDKASQMLTAQVARRPTADIVAGLRDNADSRFTPPGLGPEAPLTDLLVHGQDIRRPLDLTRTFAPETLRLVLDFLTEPGSARGFVPASRIAGLTFRADDLDWQFGTGPEVDGAAEALMMALTGRVVACGDLSGPGVAELRGRLAAG